jgi:hypothetical protein
LKSSRKEAWIKQRKKIWEERQAETNKEMNTRNKKRREEAKQGEM